MKHANVTNSNPFSHKVEINLDMLCALMLNRIGGEVDCTDIVTVDQSRLGQWAMKLLKQLTKPSSLCNSISDSPILCLSTGTRYSRLTLRRLGDQVTTQEDSISRRGFACIRTPGPVSIRIDYQLRGRGRTKKKAVMRRAPKIPQYPLDC